MAPPIRMAEGVCRIPTIPGMPPIPILESCIRLIIDRCAVESTRFTTDPRRFTAEGEPTTSFMLIALPPFLMPLEPAEPALPPLPT